MESQKVLGRSEQVEHNIWDERALNVGSIGMCLDTDANICGHHGKHIRLDAKKMVVLIWQSQFLITLELGIPFRIM